MSLQNRLSTVMPALVLLLAVGCSNKEMDDPPVARVENEVLTDGQLKTLSKMPYVSRGEAAERWIDKKILSSHAKQYERHSKRKLTRLYDEYRESLLGHFFLDSLIGQQITVSDNQIQAYYQQNREGFTFGRDAVLVIHIGFLSRADAAGARVNLEEGLTALFSDSLKQYNFDRELVYRGNLLPEFEAIIFSSEPKTVAGPVESNFGFHLFYIDTVFQAGMTKPLDLVRKQIIERIIYEKRDAVKSTIIDSLREITDLEIYD